MLKFLLSLVLALLAGCQKPLEAPELVDPVYLGLKGQIKEQETLLKDEETLLADLESQLTALEPQSNLRRSLLEKISTSRARMNHIRQMTKYHTIRARSRKHYVRKIYPKYFETSSPWPDPKIKTQYETHQRLLASPKQWDSRVPKLNQSGIRPGDGPEQGATLSETTPNP